VPEEVAPKVELLLPKLPVLDALLDALELLELLAMNVELPVLDAVLEIPLAATALALAACGSLPTAPGPQLTAVFTTAPPLPPPPALDPVDVDGCRACIRPLLALTSVPVTVAPPTPAAAATQTPVLQAEAAITRIMTPSTVAISKCVRHRPTRAGRLERRLGDRSRSSVHGPFTQS
jgi:hypothetical protein